MEKKLRWPQCNLTNGGLRQRLAAMDCSHIEKLDLSNNRLTTLPRAFPALRELNMSKNRCTSVDWLADFPELERVRLAGNPLSEELKVVLHYHLASLCPRLQYIDGMPTDSKRQALRHIRRIVRENLQEACERVIRGSSALPTPDEMDDYSRKNLPQVEEEMKTLNASSGRSGIQQKYMLFSARDHMEERLRETVAKIRAAQQRSCKEAINERSSFIDLRSTEAESRASLKRKDPEKAEATLRKHRERDDRRYKKRLQRQKAGMDTDGCLVPTCCDCLDNCGETIYDISDLPRKRNLTVQVVEEFWAQLASESANEFTWEWMMTNVAPDPQATDEKDEREKVEKEEGEEEDERGICDAVLEPTPTHIEVIEQRIEMRGADTDCIEANSGRRRSRKSKPIKRTDPTFQSPAEMSLDLNVPPTEIRTDRLLFLLLHIADHSALKLNPIKLGRRKGRRCDAAVSDTPFSDNQGAAEEEYFLVRYTPEGIVTDEWMLEDDIGKPTERMLVDLSSHALRKLLLSASAADNHPALVE